MMRRSKVGSVPVRMFILKMPEISGDNTLTLTLGIVGDGSYEIRQSLSTRLTMDANGARLRITCKSPLELRRHSLRDGWESIHLSNSGNAASNSTLKPPEPLSTPGASTASTQT